MVAAILLATLVQGFHDLPLPRDPLREQGDYGPFLTTSLSLPCPQGAVTPKGMGVRVGTGAIRPDTDLLRSAYARDGGWMELPGPPFEGSRSPDDRTRPGLHRGGPGAVGWNEDVAGDPGLEPGPQMRIEFRIRSADGTPLSPEICPMIRTVPH